MLNRRILRIKVFKALYSFSQNPGMSVKDTVSLLEASCESTRDLYLFVLQLIPALTQEALSRIEAARGKFNPTEEERNPNMKFARNGLCAVLAADPDFQRVMSRKKLSWDQCDAFLRKLYESVRSSDYFAAYMASDKVSLQEDANLFADIFANELSDNQELAEILEDMSILWNDDLEYAINCVIQSLGDIAKGKPWALPELCSTADHDFAVKLLRAAYCSFDKSYDMIAGTTPKWEKDRLNAVDVVLVATGLAEAKTFPEISIATTINEYVELSKFYSTARSRSFVNGVLDNLIKQETTK